MFLGLSFANLVVAGTGAESADHHGDGDAEGTDRNTIVTAPLTGSQ